MEALAFTYAAVAYEDPNPAPELQVNLEIPSSAWMGALSTAVVLSAVVGTAPNAEASVRFGDFCSAVGQVQSSLLREGYDAGGVDSSFGSSTLRAVQRFQSDNGLAADGVVGPQTANAMGLSGDAFQAGNSCYGGTTPGTSVGRFVSTNGSALTVRSGPGGGYAAIDYLANGTPVTVTGTSGGWSEITGGGWVSSDWLGSGGIGGPTDGDTGTSDDGFLTVSTNGSELVVRSGPGIGYNAVAYLANGSSVPYRDYYGGWYQITDGGWVSSSWVN